jgi:hypothetical protein
VRNRNLHLTAVLFYLTNFQDRLGLRSGVTRSLSSVIPAKAGIQEPSRKLDARSGALLCKHRRGHDAGKGFS